MSTAEKKFVLTHVYKDISKMKENDPQVSPIEEHFGVPWCISAKRIDGHLAMYLWCKQNQEKEWSIETWREVKITSVNGKSHSMTAEYIFKEATGRGWHQFINWEDMIKDYVIDDTLRVEIHVKIKKMTGIEKKNLRNFDEANKQFSDVVLVVEDHKFYVSKLYLASQSTYFEAMFLRNFEESEKSEITLKDINAKDFQNFLELLYGENPNDESTIEKIVQLAEMYDANLAIRKCEQFLMEISEKSLREKLQLAHRYNLKNLRDYCLSKITTVADIRSVLTNDTSEMDPSVVDALFRKLLALHEKN